MTEQALVNSIIDYLHLIGAYALRINSGAMLIDGDSRRMFRGAPAGTPDIIACLPSNGGRFLAIECKIGRNKPTALQCAALETIRAAGGLAIVAYSLEDVIAAVEQL